jgi:hypothetical protein
MSIAPRQPWYRVWLIVAVVLLLRVPFLNQAIQGDDVYYLAGAEHAQIDPLHPNHARYLFMGDMVDMQGHPHPPLNAWALAGLLACFGDVREVPFHAAYTLFSLIAALAMWSLAKRFSTRPLQATLLFLAVPAFVINGNSFESDLPFLAFWMAAIAWFIHAVDLPDQGSTKAMIAWGGAGVCAVLASLAAYQAIFLTPILALYLLHQTRSQSMSLRGMRLWRTTFAQHKGALAVALIPPAAIGLYQLFERLTSGALPAAVLAGYMQSYELQSVIRKVRSAVALTVHAAWIVSPVILLAGIAMKRKDIGKAKWLLVAAILAALRGAVYDPNPLFWVSFSCGVLLISLCADGAFRSEGPARFLCQWVMIFFVGALAIFFAGSARYLLPMAAPVAILAANAVGGRWLITGMALQFALSLGLAQVNFEHWDGYRQFATAIAPEMKQRKVPPQFTWINGEWGLRHYVQEQGGLPLGKTQRVEPGQIVVSSAVALPIELTNPSATLEEREITSRIPLRLVSLGGKSAYSTTSGGLRPFDVSLAAIDRVRAGAVLERQAMLTYVDPHDPQAKEQIVSGLSLDGWMSGRAVVLIRKPDVTKALIASFWIPPQATGHHVELWVDGRRVAQQMFPGSGTFTLEAPEATAGGTVAITIDKTFHAPPDARELGMVLMGVGYK